MKRHGDLFLQIHGLTDPSSAQFFAPVCRKNSCNSIKYSCFAFLYVSRFLSDTSVDQFLVYRWSFDGVLADKLKIKDGNPIWGFTALLCIDVFYLFSTRYVREKAYNLFLRSHIISMVVVLPAVRIDFFPLFIGDFFKLHTRFISTNHPPYPTFLPALPSTSLTAFFAFAKLGSPLPFFAHFLS